MRLLLLCLILFPVALVAQYDKSKDLVFEEEFYKSFKSKPKLDVKLDNRFSFIRDNDVKTTGIKIGLNYNRKFKVGLGLNQMLLPVKKTAPNDSNIIVPVDLEYFYFSSYIEYTYFSNRRWEFSMSLQHGLGEASYQITKPNGKKKKLLTSTILSYEPAMLIDYKIIRWVGIGTGIGYRLIYYKSPGVNENFSSPEYVIKLKIYLGEIVRSITGKEARID